MKRDLNQHLIFRDNANICSSLQLLHTKTLRLHRGKKRKETCSYIETGRVTHRRAFSCRQIRAEYYRVHVRQEHIGQYLCYSGKLKWKQAQLFHSLYLQVVIFLAPQLQRQLYHFPFLLRVAIYQQHRTKHKFIHLLSP